MDVFLLYMSRMSLFLLMQKTQNLAQKEIICFYPGMYVYTSWKNDIQVFVYSVIFFYYFTQKERFLLPFEHQWLLLWQRFFFRVYIKHFYFDKYTQFSKSQFGPVVKAPGQKLEDCKSEFPEGRGKQQKSIAGRKSVKMALPRVYLQ